MGRMRNTSLPRLSVTGSLKLSWTTKMVGCSLKRIRTSIAPEPQLAFHQRIQFCLDLHNHSVKAMRFPPKNYNQDLESAEDRREREAQDLELAKEMAEEDDDLM